MDDSRIASLAAEVMALTPAERLRMAADLLERRRPDVALTIARGVCGEIAVVLAPSRTGVARGEVGRG